MRAALAVKEATPPQVGPVRVATVVAVAAVEQVVWARRVATAATAAMAVQADLEVAEVLAAESKATAATAATEEQAELVPREVLAVMQEPTEAPVQADLVGWLVSAEWDRRAPTVPPALPANSEGSRSTTIDPLGLQLV